MVDLLRHEAIEQRTDLTHRCRRVDRDRGCRSARDGRAKRQRECRCQQACSLHLSLRSGYASDAIGKRDSPVTVQRHTPEVPYLSVAAFIAATALCARYVSARRASPLI